MLGVMKQAPGSDNEQHGCLCRLGILLGCWKSSYLSCFLKAIIGSSGLFTSLSQIMLVSLRSLQPDKSPYSSTPACLAWHWMRLCSSWKQGCTDDDFDFICMISATGPNSPHPSILTKDCVLVLLQMYASLCILCSVFGSS